MTDFAAYKLYIALKLHFETRYDYFTYNGKINHTLQNFENRKDRYFFAKIARKYDDLELMKFIVANFLYNRDSIWIGDLLEEHSEDVFYNWKRRMESFDYAIAEEIKNVIVDCIPTKEYWADAAHKLIQKRIGFEAALIIDKRTPFIESMDKLYDWDPTWRDFSRRLHRYKPFFERFLKEYSKAKYSIEATTA